MDHPAVTAMDLPSTSDLALRFNAAMERLGPFEPRPMLAVAISGGADSMALGLLAREWARERNGAVVALVVDHGLRACSAAEAEATLRCLAGLGVEGRILRITGLHGGPALAERARDARYAVMLDACAAAGIPHLLLGHHRGDQVETVMMRALSGSASRGLAGMPALTETRFTRLLRPLLDVAPGDLRAWLRARDVPWIEDPSNRDRRAQRARLREGRADPSGDGEGTQAVAAAARLAGARRRERDPVVAGVLAERVTIRPEGYALLMPGPIEPEALASLLQTIAGARFAPPLGRVAVLARAPGPATLGGARIMPAGRLGEGWLIIRESRAIGGPVTPALNVLWDGRFRLTGLPPIKPSGDITLGALGQDAKHLRTRSGPPAAVLYGLPAVRLNGRVIAVPHIGVGDPRWRVLFDPRNSAASAPFVPG